MRFKVLLSLTVTVNLFAAAVPVFSQVVPQARQGQLPFSVGAGISSFDVDWGHGRMLGGTLWADWCPSMIPPFLHGLGLELEGRDISLSRSSSQPSNFRLDTIGGGPIYTLRRFRNFAPYGKYLLDFGGIDWNNPDPRYKHETRTVMAPGLGFTYRIYRGVWARADYEYQFWPQIALMSPGSHVLNPQGFTVGAVYNFRNLGRH